MTGLGVGGSELLITGLRVGLAATGCEVGPNVNLVRGLDVGPAVIAAIGFDVGPWV